MSKVVSPLNTSFKGDTEQEVHQCDKEDAVSRDIIDINNTDNLIHHFEGVKKRGTEEIFNIILKDVKLNENQVEAVLQCYTASNLKGIISMEMGTGKTYVCLGLLQVARCLNNKKKAIITVPKNKVKEFENLIRDTLRCNVMTVTGQKPDIRRLERNFKNVDVVVAQISFWTHSVNSLMFMYNHLDEFYFSFFDEAAGKDAAGFHSFLEFSRSIPISFVANGTPIDKDTTLVRHLLYGVGATNLSDNQFKNKYSDVKFSGGREVSCTVLVDKIKSDFSKYFINLNRTDTGLIAGTQITFHRLTATDVQKYWMDMGLTRNVALYSPEVTDTGDTHYEIPPQFSPNYVPALRTLQQLLVHQQKKMIIFARNTKTIKQLYNLCKTFGKTPYIIDGQHTKTADSQLASAVSYNEDDNGIMITNIIKGTNLGTAEHIIVYDTPPDAQQLIFRAIRGMKSKTITIDWIYYPKQEIETLERVLQQTSNLSQLLDREIDMLPQLIKEVTEMGGVITQYQT